MVSSPRSPSSPSETPSRRNPVRLVVLAVGLVLARLGLVDRARAVRTTDLAWPRIVTGIARMSKSAVDVAMVGVAAGTVAITGVGFASPFWGVAFAVGGGVAGGTIALVSQRYGAHADDALGLAVRASVLVVLALSVPVAAVLYTVPAQLVGLLSDNAEAVALGGDYLRVVALAVPFAGLNLVGGRTLVGAGDAYSAMLLRAGGAALNVVVNAVLIFGLDMGVVGAAAGTVLSTTLVTAAFAVGLARGGLPLVGEFPVQVDPFATLVDLATVRDLLDIGLPVLGRSMVWTVAEFPMLAILDAFGPSVVAAFVIARRVWGIMNTPGWGFGLAASSLVGQALGTGDEATAEAYGGDVVRFAVATYVVSAVLVALFARPIVLAFVDDPAAPAVPVAISLVYTACVAVLLQGISGASAGLLDASGDTQWPFASQFVGMFLVSIPLTYLGATTSLGILGLHLAFLAETGVPAVLNRYRVRSGAWKCVSRAYRPEVAPAD